MSKLIQWWSNVVVSVDPFLPHYYIVLYIVELVFVLNIADILFAGI